MADIDREAVERVAALARLSLTAEEKETFARQLRDILGYVETMQALDLSQVPPMSHAAATGAWREDVARPGLPRERVLDAAPDAAFPLFRVPKVIGG
jgi:aspartyl-tRNA(Asn)/glutamyl-tRNA(Gln) amidotransferase subunit C